MPVDVVTGSPIVATERARFRLGSGIEIAYRIDRSGTINVGARPWLVFAHALGCDLGQWEPQIAKFAPAFNILRYDLRGHGESSAPKSGYGFDLHAEDLRGMLDAIGITQAHFVGSSLGGVIGQFAALRFPLRIASLTLIGTTARATPEIKRQMLETSQQMREAAGAPTALQAMLTLAFTNLFRTRSVEAVTAISRALRSTPVDGYVGCARALAEVDLTARLTSINCPVAVIAGAGDRHMPAILGEEIARAVPGARLRVLPNAANLMNVEQADAVNTVLADFLIGLSRLP
jgi:3-oxoadipate enol-lactonase